MRKRGNEEKRKRGRKIGRKWKCDRPWNAGRKRGKVEKRKRGKQKNWKEEKKK